MYRTVCSTSFLHANKLGEFFQWVLFGSFHHVVLPFFRWRSQILPVLKGQNVWGLQGRKQRCCYIMVDSATTAPQNGACTYWCISKQMHYYTPFSHNGYMKSLEFYENYITLFCLEKNKLFDNIILTQNHAWQSG
jgi:hypothetical protein